MSIPGKLHLEGGTEAIKFPIPHDSYQDSPQRQMTPVIDGVDIKSGAINAGSSTPGCQSWALSSHTSVQTYLSPMAPSKVSF
jgi:hypothetical protein